jgi:glycosyltransferase involved in cell wall biosynthesis
VGRRFPNGGLEVPSAIGSGDKVLPSRQRIVFFSTQEGDSWGGSEELWSQTALRLAAEGFPVTASVRAWSPPHQRVLNLIEGGVEVRFRPASYPLWKRAWRKVIAPCESTAALELQRCVGTRPPGLVVLSDGAALPPVDLLERCIAKRWPFVTIGQANWEAYWPSDEYAERYRKAVPAARRCYFVSETNILLAEKQIAHKFSNAEIIRNPFNVDFDASPAWPPLGTNDELRLACVARLHPPSKGQDILFEALAAAPWAQRRWRLYLYGEGSMRNCLEWLAQRLGLGNRVVFAGYRDVKEIWTSNHVLIMPSRYEGLPLAIVEAMLCGRPVVATNVAGHSEIIEDGVTGFLADAPTADSVADALERFWAQRFNAQEIGVAASKRIRELVPHDPALVYSNKIKDVLAANRPDYGDPFHRNPARSRRNRSPQSQRALIQQPNEEMKQRPPITAMLIALCNGSPSGFRERSRYRHKIVNEAVPWEQSADRNPRAAPEGLDPETRHTQSGASVSGTRDR